MKMNSEEKKAYNDYKDRLALQGKPRKLTEEEIQWYVGTGEPMDKAGAYGIQGYAAMFIEKIHGDYYNVMGLPVCQVGLMLRQAGIPLLGAEA